MTDLPTLDMISRQLADITEHAAGGVVAVRSHRAVSSGFLWRPGLIVTAEEALAEEGDIAVTLPDGGRHVATLVGRDPTTDVALLRIEATARQPLALVAGVVRPGSLALVVGARGDAPLAAFGIVAATGPAWRSMRGGEIDARIELDVRLRRQAEGGVMVDASGAVLGMAVFGPRQRVLVIPAATIERVAARLASHGRIPRGYLGLGLQPVRLEGEPPLGVMVMSVDAASPAAAAGVRQGDVIVTWQGQTVTGLGGLIRALGPDSVGERLTLGLRRGGEPAEASLTIGERPSA